MPKQPEDSEANRPEEKNQEDEPQQPKVQLRDLANYRDPMGGQGSGNEAPKEKREH